MKKLILFVLLLCSTLGFSQALSDGEYAIYLMDTSTKEKINYTFTVTNGKTDLNPAAPIQILRSYGDSTEIFWMNKSDVWTETQTYIFTKDRNKTDYFYVHHFRVVQNVDQEPWSTSKIGVVYKI